MRAGRALLVSTSIVLLSGCGGCSRASSASPPPGDARAPEAKSTAATAGPPQSVDAPVHFIGRVDASDKKGPRLAWAGTGIVARVRGSRIDVRLRDAGENRFTVLVDGKGPPKVLKTTPATESYALATGLDDKEHDVEMYKRTEPQVGVVQFLGFVQPTVVTPPPFSRRIEFIGDSISAGFGIDMVADFNCPLAADEDAYSSYAWITARRVKAAPALIAWSSKGLVRNFSGDTKDLMPEVWQRALGVEEGTWDFGSWTADVVVVQLGTNDYAQGDPGERFSAAYASFAGKVRARYAGAWILCLPSPMLTGSARDSLRARMRSAVEKTKAAGDTKIAFVDIAEQINTDGNGCAGHPSETTHRKMADQLVAAIHSSVGW